MDILNNLNESMIDKLYKRQLHNKHIIYIAKGGQGIVYKITDSKTHTNYALKVEKKSIATKQELYINNLISVKPKDTNIISIYTMRIVGNYVITLMELADGSLAQWMHEKHSDCEWLEMIFQIVMGVYVLQTKYKLYHSDMKPKNILFKRTTEPKKLEYHINDKFYSITTSCIFIISDFGHATTTTHSGKYKKGDIETFIKSNADLYELASIYKRLAVDYIIKNYTIDELITYGKKDPHFATYYTDTLNKTHKDTSHLPKKIQQNLILRSVAYFIVEKEIMDITNINTIPSKNVITVLNNMLYLDILSIIDDTYDVLRVSCGI